MSPSRFTSSARSWYVPFNFSPTWFSWSFLMVYSKAKLESSGYKESPCFRPFWIRNLGTKFIYTDFTICFSDNSDKRTLWSVSASKLYQPSDRRLSAKLVPTSADRECHAVSVTDPYGFILSFLDQSRYFFFQAVHQL
jgi:hypothetical protein